VAVLVEEVSEVVVSHHPHLLAGDEMVLHDEVGDGAPHSHHDAPDEDVLCVDVEDDLCVEAGCEGACHGSCSF